MKHAILGVKLVVSTAIPDVPNWVTVEMAKVEFRRREALKVGILSSLSAPFFFFVPRSHSLQGMQTPVTAHFDVILLSVALMPSTPSLCVA